jgi:hypothetical protein
MVDQHETTKQQDPLARVIERMTQTPGAIGELQDLKRTTAKQWSNEGFGEEVRLFVDGDGQPILVSRRNGKLEFEDIPEAHEYRFAFDGETVDVSVPAPLAGEYEMSRGSGGGVGIYDLDGGSVSPSEALQLLADKFGTYLYINIPPMELDTDKRITPKSLLGDDGATLEAYDIDGIQKEAVRAGLLEAPALPLPVNLGRHAMGRDDHF